MNDGKEHQTNQPHTRPPREELAPADYCDPVIEALKKDVDRTLLRENLKLTVEEWLRKAEQFNASMAAWRGAGQSNRNREKTNS
ncbi:MAG: hypothetical protein JO112_13585 [Planctomycetes bacterium]|nr:hypothetical protein [Planctomycetota bacterium]